MYKKLALSLILLSSMNATYSYDFVGVIKKECAAIGAMGLNAITATPSLEEIILEAPVAWELNKSKAPEINKFKNIVKNVFQFMIASTVARKIVQLPLQSSYIWSPFNHFSKKWPLQKSINYLNLIRNEPCTARFLSEKIGYGTLCGIITLYRMRAVLKVLQPLIKRAAQKLKEIKDDVKTHEEKEAALAHLKELTDTAEA